VVGDGLTPALDLELMLRVLLAFILGGVIGYERETTQRPAGLRTHMLVAAARGRYAIRRGSRRRS